MKIQDGYKLFSQAYGDREVALEYGDEWKYQPDPGWNQFEFDEDMQPGFMQTLWDNLTVRRAVPIQDESIHF